MTMYHYTSRKNWNMIKESAAIEPTESNVGSPMPGWPPFGRRVGPSVVWLLDLAEIGDVSHGLDGSAFNKREVRVEVDVPGIKWLDWAYTEIMHPEWRKTLIEAGGGLEAAEHWYVWPYRLRKSAWRSVLVGEIEEYIS